jgi:hypothetical protein
MAEHTLADEIITIIKSESNNNEAPQTGTVNHIYTNGYVDIQLTNNGDIIKYIQCIGEPKTNKNGVIVFLNGTLDNPIFIVDHDTTEQTILALGLGLFTIGSDGDLYVELPNGISNPFSINEDGDLLVEIPDGATNDYEINSDGDITYDRWDI